MSHATVALGAVQPGLNSVFNGTVKRNSTRDYEFQVNTETVVGATLSGLTSNAELILLNANRVPMATLSHGTASDSFLYTFSPGVYYARVQGVGKHKARYRIDITATAFPAPSAAPTASTKPTTTSASNPSNPPATNPGNPPAPTSLIPAQGTYTITLTGTTYHSDTDTPTASTQFTPIGNFQLNGTLSLMSAIQNGSNPHELSISVDTGSGTNNKGPLGLFQFVTSAGSLFFNPAVGIPQTYNEVAVVSEDDSAGTMKVQADPVDPSTTDSSNMFGLNNDKNFAYIIDLGQMGLQFSQGGTEVSGWLALAGPGQPFGGSAEILANFQGTLQS